MTFDALDLIVSGVPAAEAFFHDVVDLTSRVSDPRFAELDGGGVTIMLTPDALVPTQPARGVILHFRVDDVPSTRERARGRGASVLLEVTRTDWGWESPMVAGPEGIVVDFYRPTEDTSTEE